MVEIRDRKYLDGAKGQTCVRCNKPLAETVVAAHLTGLRAQEFGKGKGIKAQDIMTADLCDECHEMMDKYLTGDNYSDTHPEKYVRKLSHSEAFLTYILRTIVRRIDQGLLVMPSYKPPER